VTTAAAGGAVYMTPKYFRAKNPATTATKTIVSFG
jgi:hypothetical protein